MNDTDKRRATAAVAGITAGAYGGAAIAPRLGDRA